MLEPELQEATDKFFAGWKSRVESRLHMGEERYRGKWREMDSEQIATEMMDEVLDMIAYAIMYRRRLSVESNRHMPEPTQEIRDDGPPPPWKGSG